MNAPIDISPGDLETVREILAKYVPEYKVLAFGSRVTWTARQYSDIDLALMTAEPLDILRMADLREAFTQSDLPFRVDIVDWADTSENFRKIIEKEHAIVQNGINKYKRAGWREFTIGEIADVVGGGTPSTKEHENFDGNIPWLTPRDLSGPHNRYIGYGKRNLSQQGLENSSAKLLPTRSVLLSTRAPIGYVAIAKNPIATNQGFRSLLVREGFSPEYLYYWLIQNTEELERHASGSALRAIRLSLPPLSEQQSIADILGALDDKIELNRQMSETLESMARALFKSWFVDFDPVRAKMEGCWRRGESLPGLPADLWDLFPKKLINSKLGQIPEGWKVKTLGNLCYKPQYGYNASAKSEPVGPKFLRITDINKKAWIDWKQVPYCKIKEEEFDKYRLSKSDLLIARMADPGHGVMIEEEQEAVFASYLIRFRPIYKFQTRFLQYWFRSDKYWNLVLGRSTGTTRVSLNAKVLSEFPLVVPPRSISEAFEKHINSLRIRVVTNASESRILANIRDKLLPKLLSGKLDASF